MAEGLVKRPRVAGWGPRHGAGSRTLPGFVAEPGAGDSLCKDGGGLGPLRTRIRGWHANCFSFLKRRRRRLRTRAKRAWNAAAGGFEPANFRTFEPSNLRTTEP